MNSTLSDVKKGNVEEISLTLIIKSILPLSHLHGIIVVNLTPPEFVRINNLDCFAVKRKLFSKANKLGFIIAFACFTAEEMSSLLTIIIVVSSFFENITKLICDKLFF